MLNFSEFHFPAIEKFWISVRIPILMKIRKFRLFSCYLQANEIGVSRNNFVLQVNIKNEIKLKNIYIWLTKVKNELIYEK